MTKEFGKEILKCFWVHANTAYDATIRVGANQGITAGYGQLFNLSGMGPGGIDMTNELTYALLDKVVDMVASSQGAPFLINFDERAMRV